MKKTLESPREDAKHNPKAHAAGEAAFSPHPGADLTLNF
jgi:hypothetical protein